MWQRKAIKLAELLVIYAASNALSHMEQFPINVLLATAYLLGGMAAVVWGEMRLDAWQQACIEDALD
jgi:hypothetical protein